MRHHIGFAETDVSIHFTFAIIAVSSLFLSNNLKNLANSLETEQTEFYVHVHLLTRLSQNGQEWTLVSLVSFHVTLSSSQSF